jgi:hypothetical protein
VAKNPTDKKAADAAVAPTPEKAAPDLTKANVKAAIEAGAKVITENGTKADAARAMYQLIAEEDKAVIVAAFVTGATLTEKGALTYWYNLKRKAGKAAAK